jgi:hypothetical protein
MIESGMDENLAQEIIDQGANDFVMKSELYKLAPAVRRVLKITAY